MRELVKFAMMAVAAAALWLWPAPASAQSCFVNSTTLAFGTIYTSNNVAYTTSASVQIVCSGYSNGTTIRVCPFFDVGTYPAGGSSGPRRLGSGVSRLDFDVFSDAAYANRFPNNDVDASTPNLLLTVNGGIGVGSFTVYGRIPAGQTGAATGSYATTLGANIYFVSVRWGPP